MRFFRALFTRACPRTHLLLLRPDDESPLPVMPGGRRKETEEEGWGDGEKSDDGISEPTFTTGQGRRKRQQKNTSHHVLATTSMGRKRREGKRMMSMRKRRRKGQKLLFFFSARK